MDSIQRIKTSTKGNEIQRPNKSHTDCYTKQLIKNSVSFVNKK